MSVQIEFHFPLILYVFQIFLTRDGANKRPLKTIGHCDTPPLTSIANFLAFQCYFIYNVWWIFMNKLKEVKPRQLTA